MSFQIIDDVLDFTSSEKKLGKPVGRSYEWSYYITCTIRNAKNKTFKDKVSQLNPDSPQHAFETCITIIRQSESIEQSKQISEKYLNKAINLIDELEDGPNKELFRKLIKKWEVEISKFCDKS